MSQKSDCDEHAQNRRKEENFCERVGATSQRHHAKMGYKQKLFSKIDFRRNSVMSIRLLIFFFRSVFAVEC